jgi:ribonuclease Z
LEAPKITLFSTALISTWVFDETHRILFDAGDGVTAMLDSKIHKIRLAALTHMHRDHCSGLLQLLNLRGGAGDFVTVIPEGSGAGKRLASFLSEFDARSTGKVQWKTIDHGECIPVEPERHFLRAFPTDHYPAMPGRRTLSVGYQLVRHVDKVKTEFRNLPQAELDAVRITHGKDYITETLEDVLLSITGDTMPVNPDLFRGSRTLLHECTFLDAREREEMADRGHPHSCLSEALESAREAAVGRLGLYHLSRRYDDDFILAKVREACAKMKIEFPVSVALPGRLYDDLFAHAIWKGKS